MDTLMRSGAPLISTLPGRYYYDPALYAQEQEQIFGRLWVCAGRAELLPTPGAYRVIEVGGESILMMRSREGSLQAFYNVCRHRGARLCSQEAGHLKGSIQCRYHAWTYGLDGQLLGAPNVQNLPGFERSAFGLIPVRLEIWEGFIWLNLSEHKAQIPALDQQVNAPIIERFGNYASFARYGVSDLQIGKSITYEVQANWKIVVENFMECYHCGPLHPEFCELLPGFKSGRIYEEGDTAQLAEGTEAFSMTGRASRPPLPGLLSEDLRRYYGIVVMPNLLLNLFHDHLVVLTVLPIGPDRSRVVSDWLFDPTAIKQSDFDPQDAVEIFDLVNRQDWTVCELTQQGMTSRAYRDGGVFVPQEQHIRAFKDFVLESLKA